MKRIANPIETNELCSYGCGNVAKFINGSKKLMCCKSSNSCPANKKRIVKNVKRRMIVGKDYLALNSISCYRTKAKKKCVGRKD